MARSPFSAWSWAAVLGFFLLIASLSDLVRPQGAGQWILFWCLIAGTPFAAFYFLGLRVWQLRSNPVFRHSLSLFFALFVTAIVYVGAIGGHIWLVPWIDKQRFELSVQSRKQAALAAKREARPLLPSPSATGVFEATFFPSFVRGAEFKITSEPAAATILIKQGDDEADFPIDVGTAHEFFVRLTSLSRVELNQEERGLDGCTVYLAVWVNARKVFSRSVWEPNYQTSPTERAMVEAFFAFAAALQLPQTKKDYLAELSREVLQDAPVTVNLRQK